MPEDSKDAASIDRCVTEVNGKFGVDFKGYIAAYHLNAEDVAIVAGKLNRLPETESIKLQKGSADAIFWVDRYSEDRAKHREIERLREKVKQNDLRLKDTSLRGKPFIGTRYFSEDEGAEYHDEGLPRECGMCFFNSLERGKKEQYCIDKIMQDFFGASPLKGTLDDKKVGNYCPGFRDFDTG